MSDAATPLVPTTPNFNLNLPDVGGSWDEWGDETNANWIFIDGALLPIWGGQMTGLLGLSGDPTTALGAATKQYVDAVAANQGNYLPLTGGTLTGTLQGPQGSAAATTFQVGQANTGLYAPGGGNIGLSAAGTPVFSSSAIIARLLIQTLVAADPTQPLGIATKQYVDSVAGVADAPSNGSTYGRVNASWTQVLPLTGGILSSGLHFSYGAAASPTDLSRQLDLFNGTFGISITSARMNIVAPVGSSVFFTAGDGTDELQITKGTINAFSAIKFPTGVAASPTDLTKHIDLLGNGQWGMNISAGRINIVANTVAVMQFQAALITALEPIALPADPTTALQAATKQYVDAAAATIAAAASNNAGRNRIINGNFSVNARGYVSGGALAAGTGYGHDRWKGGTSGGAYTFTQGSPNTLVTITSGTIMQVIEGNDIIGGTYTLSWSGTASGRVGTGAFGPSPQTAAGIVAGANTQIEFGGGTVGTVQFEPGAVATPFEQPHTRAQIADCQRFCQWHPQRITYFISAAAAEAYADDFALPVMMRAAPSVTYSGATGTNTGNPSMNMNMPTHVRTQIQSVAAGPSYAIYDMLLTAEL